MAFFVTVDGCVTGCADIAAGQNDGPPEQVFSASCFCRFVEPRLVFGEGCGDDGSHDCHVPGRAPGMALVDHGVVPCNASGPPVGAGAVGSGSPAAANLSAVSLEKSADYLYAPLYVWPTQIFAAHPTEVFGPTDPVVRYIAAWAAR